MKKTLLTIASAFFLFSISTLAASAATCTSFSVTPTSGTTTTTFTAAANCDCGNYTLLIEAPDGSRDYRNFSIVVNCSNAQLPFSGLTQIGIHTVYLSSAAGPMPGISPVQVNITGTGTAPGCCVLPSDPAYCPSGATAPACDLVAPNSTACSPACPSMMGYCNGSQFWTCSAVVGPQPFCKNQSQSGINTAFGCIPYNPTGFFSQTLGWSSLLGTGFSFLVLLFAAFQLATSAGDKKKLQAARELIVAALTAVVLFAIAITLLNFLGIKVLNLVNLGFKV